MNNEQNINDENLTPVDDSLRTQAINALKKIPINEQSAFAPNKKSPLGKIQTEILTLLTKNGYVISDPSLHSAVSLFIDNLSRIQKDS